MLPTGSVEGKGERLFWQEKPANQPETGRRKPRERARAGKGEPWPSLKARRRALDASEAFRPSEAERNKKGFFLSAGSDDAHHLLQIDSGALRAQKRGSGIFPYSPERDHMMWRVRIPPARFLDIPERLFPPKRFQRDSGIAGFSKERRNRYRQLKDVSCLVKKMSQSIN